MYAMIHFFLKEKKRNWFSFLLCSLKACEHWNDDNGDNSRFRFAIFVLHELTQLQKYASLIMPISSVVGVCASIEAQQPTYLKHLARF